DIAGLDPRRMAAEKLGILRHRRNWKPIGRPAGPWMFEPERAVISFAVAGCAEVDAYPAHGASHIFIAEVGPHLVVWHRNQGQRRLVLVAASAGARVIRSGQNAAGDDQVVGAAGAEAAEVAGAAVVG